MENIPNDVMRIILRVNLSNVSMVCKKWNQIVDTVLPYSLCDALPRHYLRLSAIQRIILAEHVLPPNIDFDLVMFDNFAGNSNFAELFAQLTNDEIIDLLCEKHVGSDCHRICSRIIVPRTDVVHNSLMNYYSYRKYIIVDALKINRAATLQIYNSCISLAANRKITHIELAERIWGFFYTRSTDDSDEIKILKHAQQILRVNISHMIAQLSDCDKK